MYDKAIRLASTGFYSGFMAVLVKIASKENEIQWTFFGQKESQYFSNINKNIPFKSVFSFSKSIKIFTITFLKLLFSKLTQIGLVL